MVPQGKEWRAKPAIQSAGPVEPPQATGLTGAGNRSDRQEQPVRPVQPVDEQKAEVTTSASRDDVPVVPAALGEEELVDYEASPTHNNMEINVVRFSKNTMLFRRKRRKRLFWISGHVRPYSRIPRNRTTT